MFEGHVQVVPEPVAEWQAVDGSSHNILDAFYNAPERYAYTFQNYVFLTRCNQVLLPPRLPAVLACCLLACCLPHGSLPAARGL